MKLMVQLGAAQEGLSTRMAPPGVQQEIRKGFQNGLVQGASFCPQDVLVPYTQRSDGIKFYKPSFHVHFQATAESG